MSHFNPIEAIQQERKPESKSTKNWWEYRAHRRYRTWSISHNLRDEPNVTDDLIEKVAFWVNKCSPRDASLEHKTLACIDIGMWCLYLDTKVSEQRCSCSGEFANLEKCLNDILDLNPPAHPNKRISRAYEDALRGIPMADEDYRGERRTTVMKFGQRSRLVAGSYTYDNYLDIRRSTIFIDQWMTLWRVLKGLPPWKNDELLRETEEDIKTWHIVVNEIRSAERDRLCGTPNLILLKAQENGISNEESVDLHLANAEKCLARLPKKLLKIKRHSTLDVWFETFKACIKGGLAAYDSGHPDYRTDLAPDRDLERHGDLAIQRLASLLADNPDLETTSP